MDRRVQAPVIWRLYEIPRRVPQSPGTRSLEGAGVEPLRASSRWTRWRSATRVAGNGSALEGIAQQIGPLVVASVSCVRDVSCCRDIQVLPGTCGEDSVQLPVPDEIIGEPVSGRESLACAKWKLVDHIRGEHLRDVEAGRTAAALRIVRILRNAAFHAKITVSDFVQCLAPGIGDRVAEACTEPPHQRRLQRIVRGARRIMALTVSSPVEYQVLQYSLAFINDTFFRGLERTRGWYKFANNDFEDIFYQSLAILAD